MTDCLHNLIRNGATPKLRLSLENTADIDSADKLGITPLTLAARKGLLIFAGANVVLLEAARCGQVDAVGVLLDNGANADTADRWGKTALSYAQESEKGEAAQCLLSRPNTI